MLKKCPKCGKNLLNNPKKSFLGFPTVVCKNCGYKMHQTLSNRLRVVYYILAAISIFDIIALFTGGQPGVMLYFGLAAIFGLFKDRQYAREIENLTRKMSDR